MRVLQLLDERPTAEQEGRLDAWAAAVRESLETQRSEWVREVGPPGAEQLSKDRAWVLLGWVETQAGQVVQDRRGRLLRTLCAALSLLEASPLDRRDVMVVAALVRRAADVGGVDFERHARKGCESTGALGGACWEWLQLVSGTTPATHVEVGGPGGLRFERRDQHIDVDRLMRWARGET